MAVRCAGVWLLANYEFLRPSAIGRSVCSAPFVIDLEPAVFGVTRRATQLCST
jgi:hypothetical protein